MAWLSNLAGKAENLLVRLDQNASIVLLQNESKNDNDESLLQNDSNSVDSQYFYYITLYLFNTIKL